ncbi:MAG: tRNA (adenosine(37)-N6)-dimethylallyltransferase MiaA [Clostridiales Family XIII bacterium]|jgi:tRNA dimethylallyltransferase|nr:tRNA (adenosine(37)-N6)-dimethylallyltransferase MiaA [Clostridiales Family XIII bacterium]
MGIREVGDSVVIMGPTAVGKSDVAVLVAERLGGEIVSADSMQIYRGLDIGAAKPSAELRARVPHRMIDVADPDEDYSVARYRRAAGEAIADVFARSGVPVIVGGTGLYLHSLIYDMDFGGAKPDGGARAAYERLASERGAEHVHGLLARRAPEAAAKIHPNNVKRVIRALERVSANDAGESAADVSGAYKPFGFSLRGGGLIDPALFLLTRERADLVRRIGERVDAMMRAGLVEETERLAKRGLTTKHLAMLGIGYKETLGYLNGEYGLEEAIELIKIHTRRYAKRQTTWFKRYEDARVVDLTATSESEAAAEIVARVQPEFDLD